MKASNATSAKAATDSPRPTAPSSAKPANSRTRGGSFALAGPSRLPDPEFHAYRPDLADVALAGQVIASHYAEPLQRRLKQAAPLHAAPNTAEPLAQLLAGDAFEVLDYSLGWAWGYAGTERRVGYVRSEALAA